MFDDDDEPGASFSRRQGRHDSSSKSALPKIADEFLENTWVRTIIESNEMWYWDRVGKVWRSDAESYLMAWIGEKYPLMTKAGYNEVKFHVQKRTVITKELFQPNPYFLNFNGNELNLKNFYNDGDVDVEHHSRIKLSTELDLRASPPFEFLKAMSFAIPDGKDLYHCLQAFSSILLIRTMRIEKAFFFLGSGGNGKSTIMKAIENIFENYISHVDLGDLVKDRFASASLVDKLANVYADIQSLRFKDMAIFKAISSGDTISVGDKYERRRDETIKVIQIYSANKMPFVEDKNQGFLRRVSPIVFDMEIQNLDPYIDDKLAEPNERKRILAMLIRIAKITRDKGFLFERKKEEILRVIEEKEDPITQFINDTEWVKRGVNCEIERIELYQLYQKYCKLINCAPKQMNAFSRYVTNKGFDTRRTSLKRFWIGIGYEKTEEPVQHVLD